MIFLLEKQGPDDQAYWQNGPIALGHTLLKTTRESIKESQPSTLDRAVWLTADARIDGRAELISKMRGKGATIEQSATDDHLILHAYTLWGLDCLDHLVGDFAFILWDERLKRLFCATDHMGVCPLYYAQLQGGFLISNNVSAIRVHPDVSDALNEQAIGDYLLFRMNHTPDSTSFRDIQKLPPGHSLQMDQSKLKVQQYWTVPEPNYQRRSHAQYLEEFGDIFKQSVTDRMRADAAGTHLSGGMDSTSIAAVLGNLKDEGQAERVEAYTHVPSVDSLSLEKPFAEKVARKLNLPLTVYKGSDEVLVPDIDDIADLPPEPSFAHRHSPRFDIFSDSASKSPVFFAGYGGDPLMMPTQGYWGDLWKSGKVGLYLSDAMKNWKFHRQPPPTFITRMKRSRKKSANAISRQPLPNWLKGDFVKSSNLEDRYNRLRGSASVNQNARIDMQTHPLWRRVFEWHSPAYSSLPMKVRFPFFDIRLIEYGQTIPPYPWLHRKFLLREIMKGQLPNEILVRSKTALPGNPMLANIEEYGEPDWQRSIPDPDHIGDFIDLNLFLENALDFDRLTSADTKGIVRVVTLNHWLNRYLQLAAYVEKNRVSLEKYKCRT
ncbi:MAG: asparagine synthase-related protein [Parasphingorhabdus sp.]